MPTGMRLQKEKEKKLLEQRKVVHQGKLLLFQAEALI